MVGVFGIIASLNALQEAAQLALIQLHDEACPVDEVVSQQGQGVAWCGIRKSENVILPILFCTLQEDSATCVTNSGPCWAQPARPLVANMLFRSGRRTCVKIPETMHDAKHCFTLLNTVPVGLFLCHSEAC